MVFINHDKLRMICSVDMSSKKEIYMEMSKKFRTNFISNFRLSA